MKKIKSTHYLIAAVFFIWIFVIIRLISFKKQKPEINPAITETHIRNVQNKFVQEKLYLSYRDPFLKGARHKEKITENSIKNSFIKALPVWPEVEYYGYVKDRVTGAKNVDITVNKKSYMARVNQVIQGVKIKRITKDSIRVEYSGEIKTIYNKP